MKKGYDDVLEEFDFDMEFWEIPNSIKKIIIENGLIAENGCKAFIDTFQKIDNKFIEITLPVNNPPNLTWWHYRILKKEMQYMPKM